MTEPHSLDRCALLPVPRRIVSAPGLCASDTPVRETLDPSLPPQGYMLEIAPTAIRLVASDAAGAFYGRATMTQLRRVCGDPLPCGHIEDHPDFPSRGVMLDISRDKVPTQATLFRLVDELAGWKINRLELYMEHTFAYRNHREVWKYASPMTAEEIRALDAYCRERHIDLVPNQNSFGHLARWLKHPAYAPLAEAPDGYTAWGLKYTRPFGLNPLDPRSLLLVEELYEELLPNFSSRNLNVGCDETVDLGQGRSREVCEKIGKGRVYLDFLLKIHELVKRHGRVMNFWGDIILHHPELIPELPRDMVALVWGYEADHPFDKECAAFKASGIPFQVCPGTSTWNTLVGRTENALGNIRAAAENGLRHGATGLLVTDWGDNGHWQPLPFSYPGLASAAALSWCFESNRDADLARQLDAQVFHDAAGEAGRAVCELGNAYLKLSARRANSSNLFWFLRNDDPTPLLEKTPVEELEAARAAIEIAAVRLSRLRMARDDAALVGNELSLGAWMAELACRRALAFKRGTGDEGLAGETRRLMSAMSAAWLARNRPGGLDDSLRPLARRHPAH